MTKTLYIYAGTDRRELEKKVAGGISPDTSFFGFREVARNPHIEAEYLQLGKDTFGWGGGFFRHFDLTRSFYILVKFYRQLSAHDVLVIASSAYFLITFFRKLGFLRRQRFILLNLDLSIRFKKLNHSPWRRKFLLSVLNEAESIICISQAQKNDLLALRLPEAKMEFVPMGVDKSFYHPVDSTGEIVLTIGRDVGRDMRTFLEAIRLSREKAVMICSPHNVQGLEAFIPENLTVLFDQPYEVLKSYYAKAKAFVIATKPNDELVGSDCPGQTVVLDTLAYGMPLAATYMPWFDGYFENGKELLIVSPRDPVALSEAIKKITSDTALRQSLSKEGRRLIETRCNSEAMGRKIAELILSVV